MEEYSEKMISSVTYVIRDLQILIVILRIQETNQPD